MHIYYGVFEKSVSKDSGMLYFNKKKHGRLFPVCICIGNITVFLPIYVQFEKNKIAFSLIFRTYLKALLFIKENLVECFVNFP